LHRPQPHQARQGCLNRLSFMKTAEPQTYVARLLAFGVRSDVDLRQQPDRILADSGAVSLVAGLIQMGALPEPGDNKNEFVDLYAIIGRRQRMIAVRLGDEVATGKYRFSVPNE